MSRYLCALMAVLSAGLAEASPLVSSQWLKDNLGRAQVKVIEVSVAPELFAQGHIPGAQALDWQADLNDPLRRDVASRAALQAKLRALGVNRGDTLVLYGDQNNWFAAWGFWLLHSYGVAELKLLDGGRVKWEAQGLPLSRELSTPAPGNIQLSTSDERLRARLPDVLAAAQGRSQTKLVDIRSRAEYSGEMLAPPGSKELAMRAGHIPGAVNVPWQELVNRDGTFKSVAQLKALYQAVGIDGSQPLITYCRIGERSSHSWFALSQLLGYSARNYDGSWTEYGNSVGVPIANPAQQAAPHP